jgi:hypothetical protein
MSGPETISLTDVISLIDALGDIIISSFAGAYLACWGSMTSLSLQVNTDTMKNANIKKVDKLRINAYIFDRTGILDTLQVKSIGLWVF